MIGRKNGPRSAETKRKLKEAYLIWQSTHIHPLKGKPNLHAKGSKRKYFPDGTYKMIKAENNANKS
jgi:hypothetical protein